MKSTIIITLLFFSKTFFAHSQDLIISGKVNDFSIEQIDKIYYSESNSDFSSDKFVSLTADKKYIFSMSLDKIKNEKIEQLFFALDTTIDLTRSLAYAYPCIEIINVLEIVNSPLFKDQKTIKIESDLDPHGKCESFIWGGSKEIGMVEFTGDYVLTVNDTVRHLTLEKEGFTVSSKLIKMTSAYMDKEVGNWKYDQKNATLKITFYRETNRLFGIHLDKKVEFVFQIAKNGSKFSNSNGYTLEKSAKNEITADDKIYEPGDVEQHAHYPKGKLAMEFFISDNLKHPEENSKNRHYGACIVNVIVNQQGEMSDVKLLSGIPDCAACDKEVLRVVELMPKSNWIPAKIDGENVNSNYMFSIGFKEPRY